VSTSWDHDGRVWDVETGESVRVLRGHFALVTDAAFSPDGRWILTAGPTTAGLWNARTGKLLYLRGHRRLLTSVSFDSSGERILTSSRDGTVRHYVCEICGTPEQLVARAEARLARTGRELTPAERRQFLLD
jgi:WD40 repeat protein